MNRFCFLPLAVLLAVSCRRQDVRTAAIHVPEMKNEACVEIVLRAVHDLPGVAPDKTRVDRVTRMVFVTYESLNLAIKNIEFAVADAGFAANTVPVNAKAAEELPAECR